MVYNKTTWVNGVTVANETTLNNIENGIAGLDTGKANVSDAVPLATTGTPQPPGTATNGTQAIAARADHVHAKQPLRPTILGYSAGIQGPLAPVGNPATSSVNRANFTPVWITTPTSGALAVASVGVDVTTAASAGGTIRFILCKAGADGLIDFTNKLVESGEISSTTTGLKTAAYTTPIPEGLYWWGVVMHVATCTIAQMVSGFNIINPSNYQQTFTVMYKDSVTGAFPTSGTINVNGDITPQLFYTAA